MRCSKCGSENPAGKKFCGDCGAPLTNPCSQCGADNPPGKRFCGNCGATLTTTNLTTQPSALGWSEPGIRITPEQPDAFTTIEGVGEQWNRKYS
jgi:predicted amidophosphoribosyltransferase